MTKGKIKTSSVLIGLSFGFGLGMITHLGITKMFPSSKENQQGQSAQHPTKVAPQSPAGPGQV